jgi:hypothetical protein
MRTLVTIAAAAAAVLAMSLVPARAQDVVLNHLDCRFDDTSGAMVCPPLHSDVAQAPAVVAPVLLADAGTAPARGTAEWNSYCAAKFKSFDPATGTYRNFEGQTRECR